MLQYAFDTQKPEQTIAFGVLTAKYLFPTSVLALSGDLGAGKTTFANGIASGLGIHEKIISPTFNIMRCYFHAKLPLFHIDAYRLEGNRDENKELGLEEFIEGQGVTLIEWPQYIAEKIPSSALRIDIRNLGGDFRHIVVEATDARWTPLFAALKESL